MVLLLLFIHLGSIGNLFHVPKWLLPSPSDIFQEATLNGTVLTSHLMSTLKLTLSGFFIGTAVGLITAIILYLIPYLKEALYPLLILAKYPDHCTCSIISHLVWFWDIAKNYCHYISLLFPCDGSSVRWI